MSAQALEKKSSENYEPESPVSLALADRAKKFLPGGVSSGNRSVTPEIVFVRSLGARIWDADGKEYIDYHAGFGPLLLGHNNPAVNSFVKSTMDTIDLVGVGPAELEIKVAEKITRHVPSAKKVLFCNSGSEATYHAIRLARAFTGRHRIIKFQGCYHGWHDSVIMNVVSPADKVGFKDPLSAGMLPGALDNTIVLDFNDLNQVENTMKKNKGEIAGIILELIPHNIGCIMPKPGFVGGLREIADREGIVLIFDEVITGFRHDIGGFQKILGITPDITTLGKAMANGYPIAAVVGREDIMNRMGPGGDVFFAGTYNGHPVSLAACLATIQELEPGRVHEHIFALGNMMRKEMTNICDDLHIEATVAGFGSVFVTYFMKPPIENYTDLLRNNKSLFIEYRKQMIKRGIYMLPVNLKRNHISAAHSKEDVEITLRQSRDSLEAAKNSLKLQ
jgi:glutamate-1-semialdehyde 2,1-aminomutase